MAGRGVCMACMAADVCSKGDVRGRGSCVAGDTGIEEGGSHPTLMHSCFEVFTTSWTRDENKFNMFYRYFIRCQL